MELIAIGNRILAAPMIDTVRRPDEFYASVSLGVQLQKPWGPQVYGACHRAEWYRFKGRAVTNRPGPSDLRKMYWGNYLAMAEIDLYKKAGIWVDSEVGFWIPEYHLKGRGDCFVRDISAWDGKRLAAYSLGNDPIIGVEFKSTWSRGSQGAINCPAGVKPWPKWDHIVQTSIYHWFYREFANYWKIVYLARDSGEAREHTLLVMPDSRISVNSEILPFTVNDIFIRLGDLFNKLKSDTEPPRDFNIAYSVDQLRLMADAGEFGKTDTDKIRKGNKVVKGDWQCASCRWANACWAGVELPYKASVNDITRGVVA